MPTNAWHAYLHNVFQVIHIKSRHCFKRKNIKIKVFYIIHCIYLSFIASLYRCSHTQDILIFSISFHTSQIIFINKAFQLTVLFHVEKKPTPSFYKVEPQTGWKSHTLKWIIDSLNNIVNNTNKAVGPWDQT